MADIYEEIGKRIRDFRSSVGGRGISQEDLAQAVGTTANTISRWETATYKPAISDLEKLARYFGVAVTAFLPESNPKSRTNALLSATAGLDDADLDEVRLYALFRKSRRVARQTK
jgi:transcriptional regulator with XRE-family HTH domain